MNKTSLNRGQWLFWVYLIRFCGLPFQLCPVRCPQNEAQRIQKEAGDYNTVIIFNAGGWGETTLDRNPDFGPILEGILDTLSRLGRRSIVIPYRRTVPGLLGKMSGTKEQLNSFRNTWKVQAADIEKLVALFPRKQFILVGFSVGGGLSARVLKNSVIPPNLWAITVGVPGWYGTFSSPGSLVLDNGRKDPVSIGNVAVIAAKVLKLPYSWLKAQLDGRKLGIALSLQFPHHDYSWSSEEVGPPIVKFLTKHFSKDLKLVSEDYFFFRKSTAHCMASSPVSLRI